MFDKSLELQAAYCQLNNASARVVELQEQLAALSIICVVSWVDKDGRHTTPFHCANEAFVFWSGIDAINCPAMYKVFV